MAYWYQMTPSRNSCPEPRTAGTQCWLSVVSNFVIFLSIVLVAKASAKTLFFPSAVPPLKLDDPNPSSVQATPLGHPSLPASGPLLQTGTVLLVPLCRLTLFTSQPALKLAFPTPSSFWFLSYFGLLPSGTPSIRLLPLSNNPLLRPLGKPVSLSSCKQGYVALQPPWGWMMMDDGLANQIGLHSIAIAWL